MSSCTIRESVCVCVYIIPPPSSLFITCFGVLSHLHSCLKSDALKMMDQQLCHIATYRDWQPVDRLPVSASLANLAGQLLNHKFPRSHRGSFDSVHDAMTTLSQYWKDCILKRHSTTLGMFWWYCMNILDFFIVESKPQKNSYPLIPMPDLSTWDYYVVSHCTSV